MDASRAKAQGLAEDALSALDGLPGDPGPLADLVRYLVIRTS